MNKVDTQLDSREFDRIVSTLPSARDRRLMHTHDALVRQALGAPPTVKEEAENSAEVQEVLQAVRDWIYQNNSADTVRAKYARKVADQLLEEAERIFPSS